MPAERMVLDHQVIGRVDTPDGPRTRVVVVAAERESIAKLLDPVRRAGLRVVGVDLPSFALTRATFDPERSPDEAVLCANIAGVTTLAISRGRSCELTRVSPIDLEQLSRRLAERDAISVTDARARLLGFRPGPDQDDLALSILDAGLADLADDLVKTVEFHASSMDGSAVSETIISGPAAAIPNFAEVLGERMHMTVRRATTRAASGFAGTVPLEQAVPRRRPRRRGGAGMRAVNLMPTEDRRTAGGGLRSLSPATLGLFAVLVVAILGFGAILLVDNRVNDRRHSVAAVQAQVDQAQAQAVAVARTAQSLKDSQRSEAAARSLAGSRFDWPGLLTDISRHLPAKVKLTTLQGSLGGTATSAAGTVQIAGCAGSLRAVATTISRIREVRGVADVAVGSTTKGASTGPCPYPQSFNFNVSLAGATS